MNKKNKLNDSQFRAFAITTGVAILVAFIIISQFLAAIIASCIAAYILVPVYKYFKKTKSTAKFSLLLTWLVGLFGFIIPFTIIVLLMTNQLTNLVSSVSDTLNSGNFQLNDETILVEINETLDRFTGGRVVLTVEQVEEFALNTIKVVGDFVLDLLESIVSSFPRFITNMIVFFYAASAIIVSHKNLIRLLQRINPMGDDIMDLYLKKADGMTQAMIKGQFVVAIAQGVSGAVFLQLAGVGPFSFFAIVLSFLSIIPLGGGIITIPIGIILMITGNIWGGLFILLTHFLIITNIDNVLRPKLVPKDIKISPALTMISVLAGVSLFGFFGVVVGPVLFILCLTTIETYADIVSPQKATK